MVALGRHMGLCLCIQRKLTRPPHSLLIHVTVSELLNSDPTKTSQTSSPRVQRSSLSIACVRSHSKRIGIAPAIHRHHYITHWSQGRQWEETSFPTGVSGLPEAPPCPRQGSAPTRQGPAGQRRRSCQLPAARHPKERLVQRRRAICPSHGPEGGPRIPA